MISGIPRYIGPWNQNARSLCLRGLFRPLCLDGRVNRPIMGRGVIGFGMGVTGDTNKWAQQVVALMALARD